ncbi:MAG TPA: hypothetical protein VJ654_21050 [Noviherbaspirillum sp.]|nr:hypothetical protein [Noviherbaspirillum sp.]
MNAKLTAIAASFALSFAAGAFAQTSSGSSGSSMQGSQSQQSGKPSQTREQTIDQQHQAALKKCDGLKDNAKDICKAEADGQKEIAEAQAKVTERDTPKNRLELAEARAKAQYKVEKERCDDQVGDAKSACEQAAKATRESSLAQAKMQSQTQTSGSGAASGSSSSGGQTMQTAPSGSGAASSSSGSSSPASPQPSAPSQ